MKPNDRRFFAPLMFALLFFTGSTATGVFAQSARPQPTPSCPMLNVSGPDSVPESQPITATANLSGGDPNVTPTYNWTITAGTISSGQGTSSISIDTTGIGNQSVTATVDVGGYPRECSASNSVTTSVTRKVETRKFDEYGKINEEDERARLDNFAAELKNDSTATGYLLAYGGRRSQPDEAQKWLDAAADYLMKVRGIPGARSLVGVGGYREEPTIELWIAPAGGTPPMATPTVDPSEVKPASVSKPTTAKRKTPAKTKKPAKAKTRKKA
jgi:hypothetical protein